MEWTRDNRRQQINNQPLMGVAKAGGDIAVKAKAAPAVNELFCRRWTMAAAKKVGANGRAAVDNRQQWQWQSGNNQLKVTRDFEGAPTTSLIRQSGPEHDRCCCCQCQAQQGKRGQGHLGWKGGQDGGEGDCNGNNKDNNNNAQQLPT
jgi:hypothetical protein